MSGNALSSRRERPLLIPTDMPADSQGQVGLPPNIVLYQRAFTHLLYFFLDVMKLDPSAQYVRHATTAFAIYLVKYYI